MKTIDCGDCGESVPYGRLSCPACGALLASVTGPRRHAPLAETAPIARATPETLTAPEPVPVEVPEPAFAKVFEPEAPAPAPVTPELASAAVADPSPDRARLMWLASRAATSRAATGPFLLPDRAPADDGWDHAEPDAPPAVEAADEPAPVPAAVPAKVPATVPASGPWSPEPSPAPFLAPRPYERRTAPEPYLATSSLPSAYRAPALSLAMAGPSAEDAGLRAPGLTSIGRSIGRAMGADASRPETDDTAGTNGIDAERFAEIGGWFVVVGATMTVLGFVLPWSRSVIGATGVGSYFDTWGLATPTNVLFFAGLLAVLGLGIVRTAVPDWMRSGVLGLVFGSLVIGLTVPYVAGPLGADVGVMVACLGGLALVIGGAVATWATRHAEADLPV